MWWLFRGIKELWDEARATSITRKLQDVKTEILVEKERSKATEAKTSALLAEAEFQEGKAEQIRAKIQ